MFRFVTALALALVLAPSAHANVQLIQITLSNYAYAPDHLDLVAGAPVLLKFVNPSNKGHDFAAPELFASGTIAPEDRAKIEDGSVEVGEGATVEIRFTPNKAGTYKFHCTHFLHSSLGMTGTATVE
jgi:plastocyanin